MTYGDDDDDLIPTSSKQEAFTRADRGKMKELRRRVEQEKGKKIEIEKVETAAKSGLSLHHLRQDLSGEKDEERKRQEREKKEAYAKKHQTFHTKTLKEKEEESIQSGKDDSFPDPDQIIERDKDDPEISTEETVQQPG